MTSTKPGHSSERPGPNPAASRHGAPRSTRLAVRRRRAGCAAARRVRGGRPGPRDHDRTRRQQRSADLRVHRLAAVSQAALVPRVRRRAVRGHHDLAGRSAGRQPRRRNSLRSSVLRGDGTAKGTTRRRPGDHRVRLHLGFVDLTERHVEGWRLHRDRVCVGGDGAGRLPVRVTVAAGREARRLRAHCRCTGCWRGCTTLSRST